MKVAKSLKVIAALLVFVFVVAALIPSVARAEKPGQTIVELALDDPSLSTLVAAVSKAGLVDALNGNRMFTVFAPTNEAFDAAAVALLGSGNNGMDLVNALSAEELIPVLLYHVSPGERFSTDVVSAQRVRMMSKSFTYPLVNSSGVFIVDNSSATPDAQIIAVDIDASNGVIHKINQVLLP